MNKIKRYFKNFSGVDIYNIFASAWYYLCVFVYAFIISVMISWPTLRDNVNTIDQADRQFLEELVVDGGSYMLACGFSLIIAVGLRILSIVLTRKKRLSLYPTEYKDMVRNDIKYAIVAIIGSFILIYLLVLILQDSFGLSYFPANLLLNDLMFAVYYLGVIIYKLIELKRLS